LLKEAIDEHHEAPTMHPQICCDEGGTVMNVNEFKKLKAGDVLYGKIIDSETPGLVICTSNAKCHKNEYNINIEVSARELKVSGNSIDWTASHFYGSLEIEIAKYEDGSSEDEDSMHFYFAVPPLDGVDIGDELCEGGYREDIAGVRLIGNTDIPKCTTITTLIPKDMPRSQ